jgi:uncharacterized protein (DUF433 family)
MVDKPTIKGTRITVELILCQLAQGITVDEMLENYPHLKRADIVAAIEYAKDLVMEEKVYDLPEINRGFEKTKAFA